MAQIYTILICDDDRDIVSALDIYLRAEGYRTLLAYNGNDVLRLVEQNEVHLLLMDVMMPGLDGIAATLRLRETRNFPIILLTAKSALEDRIAGLEQGIDDYVTKPFSASYLKVKIQNLLTKRKQWQELYRKTLLQKGQPEFYPAELHITSYDQEFMKRLLDFIEANMSDINLKIEQLADAMNLSRAVFYTKLKAISGLSPIDFLRDIRIKRACQLIASGNYTISQVAYMTGFKDPKFFSRTFRKIMNCSPTEYKEQNCD